MRTRFWRKRNAKLDKRLNTVIETTERARKSIQLPPSRVTIDTSYLDTGAEEHGEGLLLDDGARGDAQSRYSHAFDSAEAFSRDGASDVETHGSLALGVDCLSACDGDGAGPFDVLPDALRQTSPGDVAEVEQTHVALLARAEEAERELAAVYSAAEQQEQAAREIYEAHQKEIAARVAAETAHAEAARRAEETEAELIRLRALLQSHEQRAEAAGQSHEREVEARRALEVERDGLAARLEEAETRLGALTGSVEEHESHLCEAKLAFEHETAARVAAEASRDEMAGKLAASEATLETLRASIASLEATHRDLSDALSREAEARQALEMARDDACARVEAVAEELAELRKYAADRDAAAQAAEEAAKRELEVRCALEVDLDAAIRKAEAAQEEVAALRQAAESGVVAANEGIAQERAALLLRAEEAERQLAEVRESAESQETHLREAMDARQSEMAARQAAECERDAWARRAAETETEVSALKRALDAKASEAAPAPPSAGLVAQQPVMSAAMVEEPSAPHDDAAAETRADDALIKAALRSRLARKGLSAVEASAEAEPARLPAVIGHDQGVKPKDVDAAADAAAQRRDRRVASQLPATLWREGMGQPLSCTLRDRSPSGARLEFKHASMIEGFSAFNVGDRATLTLNSAHEKTWVGCEVVWVDGNSCGVRFSGQFRSEGPAVRKSPRNIPSEKPQRAKVTRLASVFSLKGS